MSTNDNHMAEWVGQTTQILEDHAKDIARVEKGHDELKREYNEFKLTVSVKLAVAGFVGALAGSVPQAIALIWYLSSHK